MPRELAQCSPSDCKYAFNDPVGSYKGLVMPPKNFDDWYKLVYALVEHLIERYGLEEVSQWNFEVWNGKRERKSEGSVHMKMYM